jgi:hypothetical protein
MHLLRRDDVIPGETLSKLAKEIGIGWSRTGRVLFFIAVADLCIFLIANTVEFHRSVVVGTTGLWKFMREMAPMMPVWACPVLFWLLTRRVRSARIASAMLEHLRCPHCGYDIRGLGTDPEDGATVCPECGCAWKLVRAGADGGGGCSDNGMATSQS